MSLVVSFTDTASRDPLAPHEQCVVRFVCVSCVSVYVHVCVLSVSNEGRLAT